ncbi:MAG TPA: hypothetical protein V6C65_39505 [Allocoleopsis sp.]
MTDSLKNVIDASVGAALPLSMAHGISAYDAYLQIVKLQISS